MPIDWAAVPERFRYLRNRVLDDRTLELGIKPYEKSLGRHVGLEERLSKQELAELASVYEELIRREDNFAILDWLDESDIPSDEPFSPIFLPLFLLKCLLARIGVVRKSAAVSMADKREVFNLLVLFRELGDNNVKPFSNWLIIPERPENSLQWSSLPEDLRYVANAVEEYAELSTEFAIVRWLDRASPRSLDELRNVGERMLRDRVKVEAWCEMRKGTREEFKVSWMYLIFDHAGVEPDG